MECLSRDENSGAKLGTRRSASCLLDSCLLTSCLLDSCLLTSCLLDSCLLRVAGLRVAGRWFAGLRVAGRRGSLGRGSPGRGSSGHQVIRSWAPPVCVCIQAWSEHRLSQALAQTNCRLFAGRAWKRPMQPRQTFGILSRASTGPQKTLGNQQPAIQWEQPWACLCFAKH